MLCDAVLSNHAFVDGNKRTAYGALFMTLAGNWLRRPHVVLRRAGTAPFEPTLLSRSG
jgi:hypothetical protein